MSYVNVYVGVGELSMLCVSVLVVNVVRLFLCMVIKFLRFLCVTRSRAFRTSASSSSRFT